MTNYYLSSRAYENLTPWGGQQNMLLQSNAFTTTWAATQATPSQSGTDADPFGGTTAWRLSDNNTASVTHGIVQSISKAATALRYSFSIYAKVGPTLTRIRMFFADTAVVIPVNGATCTFDLTNGNIGVSAAAVGAGFTVGMSRIEPVLNQAGWYRCSLSVITNTAVVLACGVNTDNGTGFGASSVSYTGSTNYVLIDGAQLEPALYVAGTYTATTASAAGKTGSFSATLGMIRRPTDQSFISGVGSNTIGATSQRAYRCSTAGTTGANEPSASGSNPWTTLTGGTVTDNTAVWTEITGNESFQTAGTWAPYANLQPFSTASNLGVSTISSFPAGGASYAANDIIAITGVTTPIDYPIVKVSTVSSGAITAVTVLNPGIYASGTTALTTTKVTGSGNDAATITLTTVAKSALAAGDTIYVGNTHFESNSVSSLSVTIPGTLATPNILISVDQSASGHIPPVAADYLSGGTISMTAGNTLTIISTAVEYYGLTFRAGTGISSPAMTIGNSTTTQSTRASDCKFVFAASGTGTLTFQAHTYLDKVSFRFGAVASSIVTTGNFEWKNTVATSILLSGSTVPTSGLIGPGVGGIGSALIEGIDFTAIGANRLITTVTGYGVLQLLRCKFSSGVVTTVGTTNTSNKTDVVQCDSGALTLRNERYWSQATLTTDTTVVRTGGATDGVTLVAWKVATTANNAFGFPFDTIRSSIYNSTTGSSVNVSMFGVCNQASPNTGDLWLEVDAFTTASSTLAAVTTQAPASRLASTSALTADSSAWDTSVTSRANTNAYSVGNVIKVPTNVGRIFICTTAGTSAGSEPGAYASAVDGGSVTDSGAVFIAGYRFKQTIAITPQGVGLIHATIKIAKASATGLFWVDPKIVLS